MSQRSAARLSGTLQGLKEEVAGETMRGWLKLYRGGGFEALYPKRRADLGRPRRLPAAIAEALVAVKTERAGYSARTVMEHTLRAGRRFAYRQAGEFWMVPILDERRHARSEGARRPRKSFLIAFIDDATRAIPHAG